VNDALFSTVATMPDIRLDIRTTQAPVIAQLSIDRHERRAFYDTLESHSVPMRPFPVAKTHYDGV
jgi:hypothetical protein